MKKYSLPCLLTLSTLAMFIGAAPSASAADDGMNVIRLAVNRFEPTGDTYSWFNPDEPIPGATSQIDTTPEHSPGWAIEYERRIGGRWGLGVSLASTEAEMDIRHYVAVRYPPHYQGDLTMIPLTLGPLFHLYENRTLDLYCGPLLGYVFFGDLQTEDFGRGANSYAVRDDWTFGATAGLDVLLGKTNWLLTTSVRYLEISSALDEPFRNLDMNENIDIDPIVFQIGLGYTF